jgi:monoamine oxidase
MNNWHILEASNRVGGRVHTSYLNNTKPEDYQYQEMGPMRFPVSIQYPGTNETLEIQDHKMVFQLGAAVNEMNGNESSLAVNFIPWIQHAANDPADTTKRRPDGTVPGNAEVVANPSLADNLNATYSNATAVALAEAAFSDWLGLESGRLEEIATNVFRAHKKAIEDGLFDYSESMYLRYVLHNSVNITDEADSTSDYDLAFPVEDVYFGATTWKTIDKGLSSLPKALEPLVLNRTTFGIKIQELQYDEATQQISAHWRNKSNLLSKTTQSETFDYAVVAVPFTKVRLWRLPPYSSLLSRAITTMNYDSACKVALLYKTRFWEHLEEPIIGGCGFVAIPGIQSVCYPSYKINSTGPGVLLANYATGAAARSLAALPEEEHVALVQRAMVEIHGPVAAEQYTGIYDRICWANVEYQAGGWCSPLVGQEDLYLPAYFQTEFKTVFVGEHTSFTHAWIFSALESAVRGTTQLLLDMGLVDEAKQVTKTWMARWMSV